MMVLLSMQLTTLDLADNNITDDGVASLSEALKQSTCQLTTAHQAIDEVFYYSELRISLLRRWGSRWVSR